MYKIFFIIFIFYSFISCSKSNFNMNNQNLSYYKSSTHTTMKKIIKDNSIRYILTATYLNKISTKTNFNTKEIFLLGIFAAHKSNNKDQLLNRDYVIKLNNIKPSSIKEISLDTKEYINYKNIVLYNKWTSYYILEFDKKTLKKEFLLSGVNKYRYSNFDYEDLNLEFYYKGDVTSLYFQREF